MGRRPPRRPRRQTHPRQRRDPPVRSFLVTGTRGQGDAAAHEVGRRGTVDAHLGEPVDTVLAGLAARIGADALEFTDPAEAASASYRRFLRFSRDEPELARVLVELDRVNAIFEDAVTPWAMETLSRGRKSGRFGIDDLDLALTSIVGAALAAIRAILAGRVPPGPKTESRGAEMMLRGFGLDAASAQEIARRPLP